MDLRSYTQLHVLKVHYRVLDLRSYTQLHVLKVHFRVLLGHM